MLQGGIGYFKKKFRTVGKVQQNNPDKKTGVGNMPAYQTVAVRYYRNYAEKCGMDNVDEEEWEDKENNKVSTENVL